MIDGPNALTTLLIDRWGRAIDRRRRVVDRRRRARGWSVGLLGMAFFFSSIDSGRAQSEKDGAAPSEQLGLVVPPREDAENRSDEERARLAQWIEGLSAPRFQTREDATEAIAALGEEYLSDLDKALESLRSPEAKARLSGIVAKRKEERKQRITREFLRSRELSPNHEFQGWHSFSKATGFSDRKTKAMFLQLLQPFPSLIYTKIETADEAYKQASLVAGNISQRLDIAGEVTSEDGIALAYLVALCEDKLDVGLERTSHRVFSRSPFATYLSLNKQTPNALSSLYSKFAVRATDKRMVFLTCFNGEIPAARQVAVDYLSQEDATKDAESFELAMQALAKFGTDQDIPIAERWIENATVINQFQRIASPDPNEFRSANYIIQARDLALITSILLHRENPYLFFPLFRAHPLRGFTTDTVGFPEGTTEETRQQILKDWREHLKKTPKPLS
ncbi:hypothetical protein SH467x_002851 [Pirellulaceae bacterium SH467]